jgi:outer membrane lipoprotein carrier protein
MWKRLWTSLWRSFVTLQLSRLYTGLHKARAVNITNDNNELQLHGLPSAIYGTFLRSYKPLEKFVPFPHFWKDIFFARREPSPALRRARIAILLTVMFFSPAAVVRAEVLSLEQLIAKAQETYEKTKDLKARFIQEATIRSMKKTEREEGMVYFRNPKMMLWDYQKPKAKKLVINDRKAWLYIPEDRMVYVQNTEDVYRSQAAIRFLSGIGKLSEDFQIRFTKDSPLDENGNYLLTLTAKETGSVIDRLYLSIDGKTFQISWCSFSDAYGNTTRLNFINVRVNRGISDKLFDFKPPAGVEIVNTPQ